MYGCEYFTVQSKNVQYDFISGYRCRLGCKAQQMYLQALQMSLLGFTAQPTLFILGYRGLGCTAQHTLLSNYGE